MKSFNIPLIFVFLHCVSVINGQYFEDVSYMLGSFSDHTYNQIIDEMPLRVSGGLGVGDVNNDGYYDIVVSLGDNKSLSLALNDRGDLFIDKANQFWLDQYDFRSSSPHFFNYNNDRFIDLIVGSVDGTPPHLFKNVNGKYFELVETPYFDVLKGINSINISSVDYDKDGHVDLFFTHWLEEFSSTHFWKNMGDGSFKSVDAELGFYSTHEHLDFTHTASFIDINNDNYEDLLLCSDFGTSQIWINIKGEKFQHESHHMLLDENAMGSAVADFDNDGDYDWFVTSVHDDDGILEGNWGGTGNKLYVNTGNGNFVEKAEAFGIENSSWAWGTSFADLNNDGFLDLVTVNGWPQGSNQFKNDQLEIFISDKGERFEKLSIHVGINDTLQGRGISCLDYDNDGRLDIIVSNYRGPVKIYKNNFPEKNNYVKFNLYESEENPFGFGCQITLYEGANKQMQKITNASNYVSQNPSQLHFGLGDATVIDSIVVQWMDGSESTHLNVEFNQVHTIKKPLHYLKQESSYLIYPNPTNNSFSVVFEKLFDENSRFVLLNKFGYEVAYFENYYFHDGKTYLENMDISELPVGVYFLTEKSYSHNIKIIKQ